MVVNGLKKTWKAATITCFNVFAIEDLSPAANETNENPLRMAGF
jgi:hypothetical protein